MSQESLLRQFEVMADASNGVQKLRELILQLAVRGKLVPQDPSEEPASVLLERIAVEKQRLLEQRKIGRPKPQPPVVEDEAPFAVPEGWEWVRIGNAMNLVNGRAFKPTDWSTEGLPIIRIQNLNNPTAPFNYCDFEIAEKFYIDDEDLLLSWSGTPGTSFGAFVWRRGRAVLNQHIFRCELYGRAYLNDFVRLAINGRLDEMIAQAHGGVGLQHVTKSKLDNLAIVLPPLPEQRRIVAKVDELMALCDELEARQRRRAEARVRLNRSALHHLTGATDDAEFATHWQRLQENFHLLYDTPETVAELRQAVLQLAVRGKLVPQDPSEEPASVLLERIAVEKQRLLEQRKIGRPKPQPPVGEDEAPFAVPEGWEWVRIGNAMNLVNGRAFKPTDWSTEGLPIIRIQNLNNPTAPFNYCDFEIAEKFYIDDEDLLLSWSGTPGTSFGAFVWRRGRAVLNQHIFRCELYGRAYLNDFVRLAINGRLDEMIAQAHGGVGLQHVTKSKLDNLAIVLPPLPEQRRIVAKVDELMALCDELEPRLTAAREKSTHLAASVVHHFAAA